jgi:hypothetical protein
MIPTQEQLSGGTPCVSQNRRPRKSKPVSLQNWTSHKAFDNGAALYHIDIMHCRSWLCL